VALSSGDCNREEFLGWDVTGKTLGLIGAGRIGTLVAQKAMAPGDGHLGVRPLMSTFRKIITVLCLDL